MDTEMAIIEADGLTREFKVRGQTVQAVSGLDLKVEAGQLVGFLGPNGAGKTTTLRMLTTLLQPTSGSARIAGEDLLSAPRAVRRKIGYVAQSGGTDYNVRVGEELMLQAGLHRLDAATARERTATLMREFDLEGLADRQCKTLSGGQKRRLDIALGLVHDPAVLFLDEPTTGLDPQSRNNLWEHIRRLRAERGTTVFLTTHYLDEADALCDKILVIDQGRLVAEDSPEGLKQRISGDLLTVEVDGDPDLGLTALAALPQVRDVTVFAEHTLRLTTEHSDQVVADVIRTLGEVGLSVRGLQLSRPSLEDVFLTITGKSLRDEASIG
jgi:ABC-2 type transport system ATP-binding protein